MPDLITDIAAARKRASSALLDERNGQGFWEGRLSTSALSTATAVVALGSVDEKKHRDLILAGCAWLVGHQNEDGGWGDTVKSFSNVSTTLLCWSALTRYGGDAAGAPVRSASFWIRDYVGSLDPGLIAETVKARYGKDRTFSVPILMLCAICGTLGKKGWRLVLPLPFELAAFPREWFALLRLPVVSYALPALIAIGYARFHLAGPFPLTPSYWLRRTLWPRVSKLLAQIQPSSGGFLEAAPLTSFVTMALASSGQMDHPVVEKGVAFLRETVRDDGSWPIDTNLATWATTLAIKALSIQEGTVDDSTLSGRHGDVSRWLLGQQYRQVHPFTNSPPGGWAWTDLPGGVPDADDTPGAMIALSLLQVDESLEPCHKAARWLLDLQNRDGGIPTFCRGWGALPFDRSSPDLTAHTLRAWNLWASRFPDSFQTEIETGVEKGLRFLKASQNTDGSWTPLWFGNQHRIADEENPTYGTAMVVLALADINREPDMKERGVRWLLSQQNTDGGWGSGRNLTPSTVEETSLALSALSRQPNRNGTHNAVKNGARWLLAATKKGTEFPPSPIGFYFARLWYFEKIYPLVWSVEAFSRIESFLEGAPSSTVE